MKQSIESSISLPLGTLIERLIRHSPFTHNDEFRGMVPDREGQWINVAELEAALKALPPAPLQAQERSDAIRRCLEKELEFVKNERDYLYQQLKQLAASPPAQEPDIERLLRIEWWLNHAARCAPYGDDGEMQCCAHDFKREPLASLKTFVDESRMKRLAEAVRAAPAQEQEP